jgi:hypothetical protein
MSNNNRLCVQLKIGKIWIEQREIHSDDKACPICFRKFPYLQLCDSNILLEIDKGTLTDHSIVCNSEAVIARKREKNRKRKLRKKLKNQNNNEVKNDNTKINTTEELSLPQEYPGEFLTEPEVVA